MANILNKLRFFFATEKIRVDSYTSMPTGGAHSTTIRSVIVQSYDDAEQTVRNCSYFATVTVGRDWNLNFPHPNLASLPLHLFKTGKAILTWIHLLPDGYKIVRDANV